MRHALGGGGVKARLWLDLEVSAMADQLLDEVLPVDWKMRVIVYSCCL